MASFAAQLKDKFLAVVDRITGWGIGGAGVSKDTLPKEEPAKFHIVQPIEVRSRGADEPNVGEGNEAGAN